MSELKIKPTKSSPFIHFDDSNHHLCIQGVSYPEDAAKFFGPVFEWLDQYLADVGDQAVTMEVNITYFNSSSSKVFMDLFDRLENSAEQGVAITINWRYHEENEMALEYGEEFQEDMKKVIFNLISFGDEE